MGLSQLQEGKMPKNYVNCHKTWNAPKRPWERERLCQELKYVGLFGLKNKKEVWRVQYMLAKIRKAARELLILPENDSRRLFEGEALVNRMIRLGVLKENEKRLDYVLGLTVPLFLERRLATKVFRSNSAKSMHEARVKIYQRHIKVGKQLVNIPSFMVRIENENQVQLSQDSALANAKIGRTKKMKLKGKAKAEAKKDAPAEGDEQTNLTLI
eukprot:TRINITY_DN49_c0_g1_i5.p1 TRINITY_DN49_c0_g1~~TRINITY_DN49_c0_g1_i5.p1  ORF type:complete len:245 (-),score=64.28 TRINITY_DN49_c0_g1_i5:27-665(-)